MRVAQVTRIDEAKAQIDVSLRKVSSQQEKRKMAEWKREKRGDKLFEKICHDLKEKPQDCFKDIVFPLEDEFGDLIAAFEEIKSDSKILNKFKFSKKWKDGLMICIKRRSEPFQQVLILVQNVQKLH